MTPTQPRQVTVWLVTSLRTRMLERSEFKFDDTRIAKLRHIACGRDYAATRSNRWVLEVSIVDFRSAQEADCRPSAR